MAGKTSIDYDLLERSQKVIAQGALTNSKRPESFVRGVYPTHMKSGRGAELTDTKGKTYVDYICGLGTNLLGYGHLEIANAIAERARSGISLSLGSEIEVKVAEKLCEFFPFVEAVKFVKSGSEACTAAVRIARAHTGKKWIVSEGYHGWHDSFVSLTKPAVGVRDDFAFLSLGGNIFWEETAAIIVEPIMTDTSPARIEWLREIREKCTQNGVVLIFDEIITGFRYQKHSVSNAYGIEPDLICLGKAIANGAPLAAVCGKGKFMHNDQYFVSSTYAGDTMALAAALKTLELLQKKHSIEHLWEKGRLFQERFNKLYPTLKLVGYPTRAVFEGDPMTKALFWQEAVKAGVLFGASFFYNFHHPDFDDVVLGTCQDIFLRMKLGQVKLEGDLPASPFAQRVRGNK